MNAEHRFSTSVALIRKMKGITFPSAHEVEGTIILEASVVKDLILIDEDSGVSLVKVGDDEYVGNLQKVLPKIEGKRATVRLALRSLGKVYRSFDEFLEHFEHRTKRPPLFYIIDEALDSREGDDAGRLEGYNDIISFIDMLAQLSDIPHRIQSGNDIFFSGATRREITAYYKANDIRKLPKITELRDNLLSDLHHEEKRSIFKSTLLDLVTTESDEGKILSLLLARYEVLHKKYFESYNVYVQQFSINEILEEVEQNNVDLTNKLHTTIVDMNKSMFALPIAFIFAATRLEPESFYSINNTIILFCSWLAVGIFFLSLSNHKRTLDFVHTEIKQQKEKASKYEDLKERLLPPYDKLLSQCNFYKKLRISIGIALWVVFITLTGVYWYYADTSTISKEIRSVQAANQTMSTDTVKTK